MHSLSTHLPLQMLRALFQTPAVLPTSILISGLVLGLLSCNSRSHTRNADAEFDLESIIKQYEGAPGYSDQAKIVFQYSLNGSPFEEVHPCSSRMARNQLSQLNRFKLELISNHSVSLARVRDPRSQNMGGQLVCKPSSLEEFWNDLMNDPIAKHFAIGSDDVPWQVDLGTEQLDQILNLPVHLFLGRAPKWMALDLAVKTDRVEFDGRVFRDAIFSTPIGEIACRFDTEQNALVGVRLPTRVLSDRIAATSGISNVSLAILFDNTSFAKPDIKALAIESFEHPVKKFVKLPEEFPSKAIGSELKPWGLVGNDRTPFDPATAKGNPGIYFYGLQEDYSLSELSAIDSLSKKHPSVNFAWVSPLTNNSPGRRYSFSRMGYFADAKGLMLKAIDIQQSAFFIVVNSSGVIQFAAGRINGWLDDAGPVLERIRNGDDVAREMHTEYSRYYTEYQTTLKAMRPDESTLQSILSKQ